MDIHIILTSKDKSITVDGDFELFKSLLALSDAQVNGFGIVPTKAKIPHEKNWDIHEWARRWKRDVNAFCSYHDLPKRVWQALEWIARLNGTKGNEYSFRMEPNKDVRVNSNLQPYPEFNEAIKSIASGNLKIRNIGEKWMRLIQEALEQDG